MKKALCVILTTVLMFLFCVDTTRASSLGSWMEIGGVRYYKMKATAYCTGTKTATGKHVATYICASKREWFGKVAAIYKRDKNGNISDFIGYYNIEDTGGEPIRNGRVIDVYNPSYEWCRQFGNPDVYVVIYEGS